MNKAIARRIDLLKDKPPQREHRFWRRRQTIRMPINRTNLSRGQSEKSDAPKGTAVTLRAKTKEMLPVHGFNARNLLGEFSPRGEGEIFGSVGACHYAVKFFQRRRKLLPLPGGEGWGEGRAHGNCITGFYKFAAKPFFGVGVSKRTVI